MIDAKKLHDTPGGMQALALHCGTTFTSRSTGKERPMNDTAGHTPMVQARVPDSLKAAALAAYGRPDATDTALVRAALANLAGLDMEEYAATLPRSGRPRRDTAPTDPTACCGHVVGWTDTR